MLLVASVVVTSGDTEVVMVVLTSSVEIVLGIGTDNVVIVVVIEVSSVVFVTVGWEVGNEIVPGMTTAGSLSSRFI